MNLAKAMGPRHSLSDPAGAEVDVVVVGGGVTGGGAAVEVAVVVWGGAGAVGGGERLAAEAGIHVHYPPPPSASDKPGPTSVCPPRMIGTRAPRAASVSE